MKKPKAMKVTIGAARHVQRSLLIASDYYECALLADEGQGNWLLGSIYGLTAEEARERALKAAKALEVV